MSDAVEPIRTERLLLRRWRDEDRGPFAALNADPVAMEFFPSVLSRAEADAFVDRVASNLEREGWGLWALEVVATGEFIGFTGLAVPRFEAPFMPATEIGWRLARSAWGHGYATEAARAAAEVAFGPLGLDGLVSLTAVHNERSRRVMRRIGMTRDPADDFDHPALPPDSPLRPHVLYRLPAPRGAPRRLIPPTPTPTPEPRPPAKCSGDLPPRRA